MVTSLAPSPLAVASKENNHSPRGALFAAESLVAAMVTAPVPFFLALLVASKENNHSPRGAPFAAESLVAA